VKMSAITAMLITDSPTNWLETKKHGNYQAILIEFRKKS